MINPAQKKAVEIACKILHSLKIQPGQREKEIAGWLKEQFKKYKVRPAFTPLVASGKRSAKPHAHPTGKKINKGDQVFVDFGVLYKGYRSDLTRTFFAGRPTPRQKHVYQIVKRAQKKAMAAVKAGVKCREVDRAAREYLKKHCAFLCQLTQKKCPGDCFIHTTGHGIGRKVHQGPRLSQKNHQRLRAGQVITIEPGIYVKGWGGIRLEDMVLVTKKGYNLLTR